MEPIRCRVPNFEGQPQLIAPSRIWHGLTASAEEFDRDLRRHLVQGALHFLSRICQPVRIDVDPDVAALAPHAIAELEACDRLFEFVSAVRTLEFDHMRIAHGAAPFNLVVCVDDPENATLPPRNGHASARLVPVIG
jgi:hypothetical protein